MTQGERSSVLKCLLKILSEAEPIAELGVGKRLGQEIAQEVGGGEAEDSGPFHGGVVGVPFDAVEASPSAAVAGEPLIFVEIPPEGRRHMMPTAVSQRRPSGDLRRGRVRSQSSSRAMMKKAMALKGQHGGSPGELKKGHNRANGGR